MEGRFLPPLNDTRFRHGADDAEEGEVNDGSEPEDVDSGLPGGYLSTFLLDPTVPSTGSPRVFKSVQTSTLPPVFRPTFNPEFLRFNPLGPGAQNVSPFPGPLVQRQENSNPFPLLEPPNRSAELDVSTPPRNVPTPNSVLQRFGMLRFTHPPPLPFLHPPGGPPTMPSPSGPFNFTIPNGPTQPPPPRLTMPTALNPPTLPTPASGSQQEIEQMHRMYQKACQLYERAVAKVNSSASTLPLGPPPRPPPPPFFPVPIVTDTLASRAPVNVPPMVGTTSVSGGLFPGPPDPPCLRVPVPFHEFKPRTEPCTRPEFPPPTSPRLESPQTSQAPLSRLPQSTYDVAYAAAYKQTMTVMPSPANGGPAPNTPEHAATWQRYMDYHLRYYLQAYASMTTTSDSTASKPVVSVPSTTIATTSTPVMTSSDASGTDTLSVTERPAPLVSEPIQPATSTASSPPSPKRSRHSSSGPMSDERSSETVTVPSRGPGLEGGIEANPSGLETQKMTSSTLMDDTRSSRCIWISNLTQGVKAVELKERCAPYGHVQTIKIIGSRKSTPPSIYAYLVMETADAAQRLVEGLQGAIFHNQEIKIKRINALPIP